MTVDCAILCLNSGSSSLKFSFYRLGEQERLLGEGAVERIGLAGGHLWFRGREKQSLADTPGDFPDHEAAARAALNAVSKQSGLPKPDAAGHRVVHGGPDYTAPQLVDAKLIETLRQLVAFAPLHLPSEIRIIETLASSFPQLPQVACFDTAFHRRMPEVAQRFPLPRNLWQQGIRRYGFHGLSYEYIVDTLKTSRPGRTIIAHLGNGASMAAVRDGMPLDTTMGFTPAGGFMMGTRSGDLDPGALIHLLAEKGYDAGRLNDLVNYESGLLGVSGVSSDMKTLLEKRASDARAAQAVEMFCYHIRKHIGGLAAVLGGLDTLVFTGGIGERAAPVRWEICQGLSHLGIHLDADKNGAPSDVISTPESSCVVRVIPTNEDLMIARHTRNVLSSVQKDSPAR